MKTILALRPHPILLFLAPLLLALQCGGQSQFQPSDLFLADFILQNSCSAKQMAVSTGTEILILDPEHRVYEGVVPASPGKFSSLSPDGSLLAVSESAGFGQIQFYGGAPDYQIPMGQISPSPGQGSAFRFTDNAGGYFFMDQG
ncbi:MAG: hypothetical protein KDK33_08385 [Leptospiraceae bacterium]|nr:hypothetical protein [Leptospiraceae bacterium]